MIDTPPTSIAILKIDHPSRGAFDDRLRRAGCGYDRLRIDDILRRAGYRPARFEYLPDLFAACDARAFDVFVVQCETACYRTTEAIRTLRARFADTVAIVSISQRDTERARPACFMAGSNEHLPYSVAPDALVGSLSTWLRWSHHRATYRRRWRIGQFEFDSAERIVRIADRDHVLTEKHFQIATAFFLNMDRALDRAHEPARVGLARCIDEPAARHACRVPARQARTRRPARRAADDDIRVRLSAHRVRAGRAARQGRSRAATLAHGDGCARDAACGRPVAERPAHGAGGRDAALERRYRACAP
ncbi:two-component regulatory system response regulator protein [Burkholderia sp. TJI49]|nr:two-component regulatory system response regulator protein [Burkholderia sp. TJI49]